MAGLYISDEDVKVRLVGKVRFTEDLDDENRMSITLLRRLINEAEGQVEMDLSPRYEIPFQTKEGTAFKFLPERPTKNVLRTLCEIQSVIMVLETDFGRGAITDASKYAEAFRTRYTRMIKDLLGKKNMNGEEQAGWGNAKPPLPGLKLSYMNMEADDGFGGQILSTNNCHSDYAAGQINDPGASFWAFRV